MYSKRRGKTFLISLPLIPHPNDMGSSRSSFPHTYTFSLPYHYMLCSSSLTFFMQWNPLPTLTWDYRRTDIVGTLATYEGHQTSYICFRDSPLSWWPMVRCGLPFIEDQSLVDHCAAGHYNNPNHTPCPKLGQRSSRLSLPASGGFGRPPRLTHISL